MSAITDALNTDWTSKEQFENIFTLRAVVEQLYNNLNDAITQGSSLYPTGNTTFDNYVQPIVQQLTSFKTTLDGYTDFINWRQP